MVWYDYLVFGAEAGVHLVGNKISGLQQMLQLTTLDCNFLDPFLSFKSNLISTGADMRRGMIIQLCTALKGCKLQRRWRFAYPVHVEDLNRSTG